MTGKDFGSDSFCWTNCIAERDLTKHTVIPNILYMCLTMQLSNKRDQSPTKILSIEKLRILGNCVIMVSLTSQIQTGEEKLLLMMIRMIANSFLQQTVIESRRTNIFNLI